MIWNVVTSIAAVVSTIAYILTALYIRAELKALEKDRYLTVTSDLFSTWQSREFMEAQLWLMHRLDQATWPDFVAAHRSDFGEIAFHRVGAFYDRVGTLVRLGLIDDREIISTVGGYAIAVWQKIGPLVHEARRLENSTLFADFERLLPACHECYVPSLGPDARVHPFTIEPPVAKVAPADVARRLDAGEPLTLLDVRHQSQVEHAGRTLPDARLMPVDDLERRYRELPADREIVAFCA